MSPRCIKSNKRSSHILAKENYSYAEKTYKYHHSIANVWAFKMSRRVMAKTEPSLSSKQVDKRE